MKNFIQHGDTLTVRAPADVASGAGVLVGAIFGVASYDTISGAEVEVSRKGVFTLPKAVSQSWTAGVRLYWDNTNSVCTTTATANVLIGAAVKAAASADTSGTALLDGTIR